jgi:hypothetical protein
LPVRVDLVVVPVDRVLRPTVLEPQGKVRAVVRALRQAARRPVRAVVVEETHSKVETPPRIVSQVQVERVATAAHRPSAVQVSRMRVVAAVVATQRDKAALVVVERVRIPPPILRLLRALSIRVVVVVVV